MGIIDIIFVCIILLGFISGIQKGLLASFFACVAMAGAWFASAATYTKLSSILVGSKLDNWLISFGVTEAATSKAIFEAMSFAFIFLAGFALLLLIVNLFNNVLRFPQLRIFDGLLGGILGIARAAVLFAVVIAAIRIVFVPVSADIVENLLNSSVVGGILKDFNILSYAL